MCMCSVARLSVLKINGTNLASQGWLVILHGRVKNRDVHVKITWLCLFKLKNRSWKESQLAM